LAVNRSGDLPRGLCGQMEGRVWAFPQAAAGNRSETAV